jgi:hypothetical protein
MYHHLMAKLLYLCKHAHPNLQTTVSFLTTWVTGPDEDDWKKLAQCILFLHDSKDLYLTLESEDGITVKWWINTSFAVHLDMKSHTGGTMSLGKGLVYSLSWKQCINTKNLTEAELVGVDDGMPVVIWTQKMPHGSRIWSERWHHVPGQPKHYLIGKEWEDLKWTSATSSGYLLLLYNWLSQEGWLMCWILS